MTLVDRIERWVEGTPTVRSWLARVGRLEHGAPHAHSARHQFKATPRGQVILPPELRVFHALFRCKHPGHAQVTTEWFAVEERKVHAACFCRECGKMLTEMTWWA